MIAPPPKKRPLWQIHLSTAVLMMLSAGAFLWGLFGPPEPPGAKQQSDWVEKDGMASRISVQNSKIVCGSPITITLDLRNASKQAFCVVSDAFIWQEVFLEPANGRVIRSNVGPIMDYVPPNVSWFTVLKPGEKVQHVFEVHMRDDGVVQSGVYAYKIDGPNIIAHLMYSSEQYPQVEDPTGALEKSLGAPIWRGKMETAAIPLILSNKFPWTVRRFVSVLSFDVFVMSLVAVVSEFIIRRCEGREPPAPR